MNLSTLKSRIGMLVPLMLFAFSLLLPVGVAAQSKMRIVNVFAGGVALDTKIAGADAGKNIAFRDATANATVSGNTLIELFEAGTTNRLQFKTYTIDATKSYTLFATGIPQKLLAEPTLVTRPRTMTFPNGTSKLAVFHGGPDAGDLDISITDSKGSKDNFNGMTYKESRPHADVEAGAFTVEVAQKGGAVFYRAKGTIASEKAGTIIITGRLAKDREFKVQFLVDNDDAAQQPVTILTPELENKQIKFRVANLVPDVSEALDIYIDNVTPAAGTDVAWRGASEELITGDGARSIKLVRPGVKPDSILLTASQKYSADSIYTITAIGALSAVKEIFYLKHKAGLTTPAGKSLIRLFHASVDAANLDVTIKDASGSIQAISRKNIGYRYLGDYFEFPAGQIRVEVAEPGQAPFLSAVGSVGDGKIITIAVNGRKLTADELGVSLIDETAQEAQSPITLLTPVAAGEAKVRVVHVYPDVSAKIDIYADAETAPRETNLGFREATGQSTFAPGAHVVTIRPAGLPAPQFDANVMLNADTVYTVYAYKLSQNPAIILTRAFDLAPTSSTQSLVRVAHVSESAGAVDVVVTPADNNKMTFSNVAPGSASEYAEVAAGNVTVDISTPGGAVFYRATGNVSAGSIVTVVATGVKGATNDTKFALNVVNDKGEGAQKPLAMLTEVPLTGGVADDASRISDFTVAPNPASGLFTASFDLRTATAVRIALYDGLGREVKSVAGIAGEAGSHTVSITTDGLSVGLYNLVLTGADGSFIGTRSVIVVK